MAKEYLTIHTSVKSLAKDVIHLVDKYTARQVDDEILDDAVSEWAENCPNLLFTDESRASISSSLLRYIGKRRAAIIMATLKRR